MGLKKVIDASENGFKGLKSRKYTDTIYSRGNPRSVVAIIFPDTSPQQPSEVRLCSHSRAVFTYANKQA